MRIFKTSRKVLPYLMLIASTVGCSKNALNPDVSTIDATAKQEQSTSLGNTDIWPKRTLTPARDAAVEQRVDDILVKMSIEEKVGQMMQPELRNLTPEDIKTYHIGSVLNGGGSFPNGDKYASVQDWVDIAQTFYEASMDESDGHVGIPILWGSDAVHGNNNLHGATLFPHNIGLGAANDTELMRRIGQVTALELAVTGIDWTFGPTVAVVRDVRWGRTYESYSEDPAIVNSYAKAMVEGIQGDTLTPAEFQPRHVIATAKHFLGDGGTTRGIDRGDTEVSEEELRDIHAAGYISALDANVMTTMASFNSWKGKKLHGHEYLLTEVLKGQMGFDGFIVSDWNGHRFVDGCTVTRCPQAINAGIDLVMVPEDWRELYKNTVSDVVNGTIPMARIDDAVRRILRVKMYAGLFDAGPIKQRPLVGDASLVGHEDHRALAREAVQKSLVLLKNNHNTLPINPTATVLVAGDAADNIGKQTGGWTLTWQGTGNSNDDFPGATSILDGLKTAVDKADGRLAYDVNGNWQKAGLAEKPDVAVVVFGEAPYAEWHGDITNIEYQRGIKKDLAVLKALKKQGVPVVSVFISGRPLWLNPELNASDAFVAAWLPGSEGAGIADVLLAKADGSVNQDFSGRLSFSWPKYINQAAINTGDAEYDPLFAYGYGLSYQDSATVANDLSEVSQPKDGSALEDAWLFVSRAIAPWEFMLIDGEQRLAVSGSEGSTADGNLTLRSIDKLSQEDARQLTWKGLRPASVTMQAVMGIDFTEHAKQNGYLTMNVKGNIQHGASISVGMGCAKDCTATVDLTTELARQPAAWHVVNIPLSCFGAAPDVFDEVRTAVQFNGQGMLAVAIADMKITGEKNKPEGMDLECDG